MKSNLGGSTEVIFLYYMMFKVGKRWVIGFSYGMVYLLDVRMGYDIILEIVAKFENIQI